MADDYSTSDLLSNKRKYSADESSLPPPPRRATGFSAPILSTDSAHAPPHPSYNSVAPPLDEIQQAKQRAQEIAARLFNNASVGGGGGEVKRVRVDSGTDYDSGDRGYGSGPTDYEQRPLSVPSMAPSYGYQGASKKIDIPNGRVGVIIGKGGETIKYLQMQSGAKIQITRDAEADRNCPTRPVEISGTPDQIAKAEQLVNDVLNEAESGGSGTVSRRVPGQSGGEEFDLMVPNTKVGLVIGKGGETIKNMQARTGARIQVIPLRLPPGDTSTERLVKIEGTYDQIEQAKQLISEVTSDNRPRNPGLSGGYSQQGYQNQPSANWAQPGAHMQQGYGGYAQPGPGGYPGLSPQYNMPAYGGYPQHGAGGYPPSSWDQSSMATGQQPTQGTGYDYYNQQNPSQQTQTQGGPNAADNGGYYNQTSAAGYGQQGQVYPQDAYSGGYQAVPQTGYDQTQAGYSTAQAYGSTGNPTPESQTTSQVTQVEATQVPSAGQHSGGQQGYSSTQQPNPNPATATYQSQGAATQPAYGTPPSSQPAYGTQPPIQPAYNSSYGQPQGERPASTPPAYGTPQPLTAQSGGYAYPGYQHPQQPPTQPGYAQPDSASQKTPAAGYGVPPAPQTAYGAQQPTLYGNAYYTQPPPPYGTAGTNGTGNNLAAPPQAGGTTASPKSGK